MSVFYVPDAILQLIISFFYVPDAILLAKMSVFHVPDALLAKMNVFHVKHGYKPTLLVDDLFFGIDDKNLSTVVKLLVHSKGNIVLTAPNIYMDILDLICKENDDIQLMNIGAKD